MPIRFIREPLGIIITCGPEAGADSTVIGVFAAPFHFKQSRAKLSPQAVEVLRVLVAGRPCPMGKTYLARRLREKRLAQHKPDWAGQPSVEMWEATDLGRKWLEAETGLAKPE